MLKKVLLFFVVLLVLIISALVALPIIFKDDILALVEEEANNNLNAELSIGEIDLTMFQHFPDLTLIIEDVRIDGVGQFEGITLADIEELKLSLDIMSVINGERIVINTIGLERPNLHVLVLNDGTANYDIAPASEDAEEEVEEPASGETSFNIGLQEYYIRNANIIYDDRAGGMYAALTNFSHGGNGDFTQDDFLLKTKTTADAITYRMEGVSYLSRTKLDIKFNMNMNLPNMRFEFDENYVRLNALELGFYGMMAMPEAEGDPIDFDMTFQTNQTTFKSILSLVPAIFMSDFESMETDGELALSGMVKGRMVGDQLPAFALDLMVEDARFNYPDLPSSAENIAIDLHVKNPGGSDDATVIDLNQFHVELADNSVDVVLHMRTPISDPFIQTKINMDLDLAKLGSVIPLEEGQALSGKVYSNIEIEGTQSAIDKEQYDQVKAAGLLALSNIDFKDPELPYTTVIETCSLNFSPAYAELSAFKMMVDKSDISLVGRVDNIIGWYVAEQPLSGKFTFTSSLMDLNAFMTDEGETGEEAESTEEESAGVAEVPAGYDFELNTAIGKLLYEDLEITDLKGQIILRDQKLDMRSLAMRMLGGSLNMSGYYATLNPAEPDFDVNMDIESWDIVKTYTYLDMAQQMAPIMEDATGKFSTNLKMKGQMDAQMEIKYNTLDGGGTLITQNVTLEGPKALKKIAEATKYSAIERMELNDTRVAYYFEDGRINVDPTSFVIGREVPSIFSGSHRFDMTLDYVLNLDIPTRVLGGTATQLMSGLMASAGKAFGANASVPERIKMDVLIGGTSEDPVITPKLQGSSGVADAKEDLKNQAKEAIDAKKDEMEAKAKAELDKAKADAEKAKAEAEAKARAEADKAKAKAEAEAAAARKKAEEEKRKAEEEAKRKAEEAKKKAEEEAKNKVKGLFK